MVLCEVVSPISISWFPEYLELSLFNSVLQPIISHINSFTPLLLDSHIDNERTLRIQSGIDAKLDSIQNDLDECMEDFTAEQGKRVDITLILFPEF